MDNTTNSLNWFEIPAADIERAKTFYQTIFDISMHDMLMGEDKMAFFPWEMGSGKATGSLVESPNHIPSMQGTVVYLNANPAMDNVLAKVEEAGGKIAMPKTSIGENGNIAFIIDTEGNKVGLHSMQ